MVETPDPKRALMGVLAAVSQHVIHISRFHIWITDPVQVMPLRLYLRFTESLNAVPQQCIHNSDISTRGLW